MGGPGLEFERGGGARSPPALSWVWVLQTCEAGGWLSEIRLLVRAHSRNLDISIINCPTLNDNNNNNNNNNNDNDNDDNGSNNSNSNMSNNNNNNNRQHNT